MKKEETHNKEKERCDKREERIEAKGREREKKAFHYVLSPPLHNTITPPLQLTKFHLLMLLTVDTVAKKIYSHHPPFPFNCGGHSHCCL